MSAEVGLVELSAGEAFRLAQLLDGHGSRVARRFMRSFYALERKGLCTISGYGDEFDIDITDLGRQVAAGLE